MADSTFQTLNSFYSAVQRYGFSRDFQARVDLLKINGNAYPSDGLLYIKNFSIPGTKKAVASVKYQGVDIHSPSTRDYGDSKNWDVTFYVDQALQFKYWLERSLTDSAIGNSGFSGYPIGDTGYAGSTLIPAEDNVAQVSVYNDQLQPVVTYNITGLFVIDMPSISYSLDGAGKQQEVKVKFGYQIWEYSKAPTENDSNLFEAE